MQPPADLTQIAILATEAEDLESLVRPLLAQLAGATGLDSAVLTIYDRQDEQQVWRFVHDEGRLPIFEGLALPWAETLCQRMLVEGRHVIRDVGAELPDHPAFTLLKVRGFVSVPYSLVGRGGETAGTLCGGSRDPVELSEGQLGLWNLFATLIADRLAREIELGHERLRAERAERRLRERIQFVASAEHALKSPLAIVSGWSLLLATRYDELDATQRIEAAHRVHAGAERLRGQVDELLGEARTSVLAGDLDPRPLDVGPYLREFAAEYAGATPDHRIEVVAASGQVLVDRRALDHVIGHLVDNALKYAPAASSVRLSAAPSGNRFMIRVDDDGPGIQEGLDPFAAFVRGRDEHRAGAGLGLHIVRTLVEASGGMVMAGNRDGGGARFQVQLPLPEPTAPPGELAT